MHVAQTPRPEQQTSLLGSEYPVPLIVRRSNTRTGSVFGGWVPKLAINKLENSYETGLVCIIFR